MRFKFNLRKGKIKPSLGSYLAVALEGKETEIHSYPAFLGRVLGFSQYLADLSRQLILKAHLAWPASSGYPSEPCIPEYPENQEARQGEMRMGRNLGIEKEFTGAA